MKDLGFLVTGNLKFSEHCQKISAKAIKICALLFRVFRTREITTLIRAYKVYVRPIVESGISVWNPYLKKDIDIIEKVQRYFTRRLFWRCKLQMLEYYQRINFLDLETLERRRIKADLTLCYKMKHDLVELNFDDFFEIREYSRASRGHSQTLITQKSRIDARKHFFCNRIMRHWNSLTESVISARTAKKFRENIIIKEKGLRFG